MRKSFDNRGCVARIEFDCIELAARLGLAPEQVEEAPRAFPRDGEGCYAFDSRESLERAKNLAALMRTGMSEKAALVVEKAGHLSAYADLAADCPRGLTAHVWRSYALVAMMQNRYGIKLDAVDLARRADLRDEEMATMHLELLKGLGWLKDCGDHWEHKGPPKAVGGGA